MKILFLGNSATYVHDVPGTLARLAGACGIGIETAQITPGGCTLAMHADAETELGQRVLAAIGEGHDLVILQDNGNCVSTPERREACADACRRLAAAIRASGAAPWFYIRPPYGKLLGELSPVEQCREFDRLFGALAEELGFSSVPVNRAFAEAIRTLDLPLWGPDNAHTSPEGAYLAVCTFYAALTGRSACGLGADSLPPETARMLAEVADRVVLGGVVPW